MPRLGLNQHKLPADIKRKTLIKVDISGDSDYGKRPKERTIDELLNLGIINIDKPSNPTSHEVVAWVKRILKIPKAGHGGTLDPKVTGCLPTALGKSTRAVQALLPAGKEYVTVVHLHGDVEKDKVKIALNEFIGKIYQVPPQRSSVKRRLRVRNIYYIDFLQQEGRDVLFRVGCQAGTYIRKLAHDLGLVLGVGAQMRELRRTRSGPFGEDTLVTLHELTDACYYFYEENNPNPLKKLIQPIENAFDHLPFIVIRDSAIDAICHGASLMVPGVVKLSDNIKMNDLIVIKSIKGEAIALASALLTSKDIMEKKNGVCCSLRSVIMIPGTYPKGWN